MQFRSDNFINPEICVPYNRSLNIETHDFGSVIDVCQSPSELLTSFESRPNEKLRQSLAFFCVGGPLQAGNCKCRCLGNV